MTTAELSPPIPVRVKKKRNAKTPKYATAQSAGADAFACLEENVIIEPGKTALIPTGITAEIPPGYEIQVRPRSGLALKHGLTVLNSPGTIDSDYRGEIGVILINHSQTPFTVEPEMRIAQLVLTKVETTLFIEDEGILTATERGSGGFGHSGTA